MSNTQPQSQTPPAPERNTNLESLVFEGAFITKEIERLKARLMELKLAIDPFFPAQKTQEKIYTPFGVATRKVTNQWGIYEENIDLLRGVLGELYPQYVDEIISFKVKPKLRSIMLDADSALRDELEPCVYVDQKVNISFKSIGIPGNSEPKGEHT